MKPSFRDTEKINCTKHGLKKIRSYYDTSAPVNRLVHFCQTVSHFGLESTFS